MLIPTHSRLLWRRGVYGAHCGVVYAIYANLSQYYETAANLGDTGKQVSILEVIKRCHDANMMIKMP